MSEMSSKPLNGMSDIGSPEVGLWQHLEAEARKVFKAFCFDELRTPVMERTELFVRSLGDATDVVQKEMYTLERSRYSATLRPEGTAGVIRHIAGLGQDANGSRVFYIGPMFRAERPQAGRKRQFHQLGAEMIGEAQPAADAECIAMQMALLKRWGMENASVQLNTRGRAEDMRAVADGLRELIKPQLGELCEDCCRRFDTNILRVLDCKQKRCAEIAAALPAMTEFMSEESREYFTAVQRWLDILGVEYTVNPLLVRGLDYYEHTVWEIRHGGLGAQDALSGGGRYRINHGRNDIQGVGFALGLERVVMALKSEGIEAEQFSSKPDIYLVSLGETALQSNAELAMQLRSKGLSCAMDWRARSMKAQMRTANKTGAAHVIIRGDNEVEEQVYQVKDMAEGTQQTVKLEQLLELFLPSTEG